MTTTVSLSNKVAVIDKKVSECSPEVCIKVFFNIYFEYTIKDGMMKKSTISFEEDNTLILTKKGKRTEIEPSNIIFRYYLIEVDTDSKYERSIIKKNKINHIFEEDDCVLEPKKRKGENVLVVKYNNSIYFDVPETLNIHKCKEWWFDTELNMLYVKNKKDKETCMEGDLFNEELSDFDPDYMYYYEKEKSRQSFSVKEGDEKNTWVIKEVKKRAKVNEKVISFIKEFDKIKGDITTYLVKGIDKKFDEYEVDCDIIVFCEGNWAEDDICPINYNGWVTDSFEKLQKKYNIDLYDLEDGFYGAFKLYFENESYLTKIKNFSKNLKTV